MSYVDGGVMGFATPHDPIAPYDGALPPLKGEEIDPDFQQLNPRRKDSRASSD